MNNGGKSASFVAMLEAGVQAICESGVDRISVSQVAKITGHTRPTFYSYFGDTNGLLAEIWLAWCDGWLERLADLAYRVELDTEENQKLHLALTEILAMAHRSSEVLEVVEPAIANWWKKHETATDLAKMKVMWLVGERLGTSITSAVDPKAASAAFVERAIEIVPDQQSVEVTPFDEAALPKVSNPTVASESVESQLVQAAVDVIASSGVAAASMARIARKAQVSTGTIYPRFENLTDLVDASFELSVSNVIEQNFTLLGRTNFEPEDFGLFIMAGLGKPRTNWRNFRVEIHLEGRLRESLKKRITQNLQEANARVSEKLIQYKFPALIAGPIPYLVHTVGIGFAILQNAGLNLLALDHRVMAKEVVQAISKIHQ